MNHLEIRKILQSLLFFISSELDFRSKKFFFAVFGRYFTPWIRIRIQEAKILRIQRIRIQGVKYQPKTAKKPFLLSTLL